MANWRSSTRLQMSQENRRMLKRVLKSIAAVVVLGFLTSILYPVFASAHAAAGHTNTYMQLKSITLAMLVYGNDHDDRFPPGSHWNQTIGLSDDSMRNEPVSGFWRVVGQAQESHSCCALNRAMSFAKLDDLDPNKILITVYLAQRPDQVTDATPTLPLHRPHVVSCVNGELRHLSQEDLYEALANNTPVKPIGF
jgi:hypothetical protein